MKIIKPRARPADEDILVAISAINNYQVGEEETGQLDAESDTYASMTTVVEWLHSLLEDA